MIFPQKVVPQKVGVPQKCAMVSQKGDHCFVVSFMIYRLDKLQELLMARIHGIILADPLVASI